MNATPEAPAAGPPRRGTRTDLLLGAALLACLFAAYHPALAGGRILDDDLHLTAPELQSPAGLGRIWFEVGATQQYYPLLHTAFWLEHRLWGDHLVGYHLVNLLLHAAAAVGVLQVMRRLGLAGGWLGAFIFALHPVCVESVAWIAEQKNTLSLALAVAATLAYLHFDTGRRSAPYWLSTAAFALALLSKTAVASLPAVLLVIIWWRRGRLRLRRDLAPLLPWVGIAAAVGAITVHVERGLIAQAGALPPLTLPGRFLVAGRVFWFYLGKFAFPAHLAFYYPKWAIDPADPVSYLFPLAVVAVGLALAARARTRRSPLAVFLCYGAAIAPVAGGLGVEWFNFSYVADHLQELSVFVLSAAGAAALTALSSHPPLSRPALRLPLAGLLLAGLGGLAWNQARNYRDPVAFYAAALRSNPDSEAARRHLAVAHYNLGVIAQAAPGGAERAAEEYAAALGLQPGYAEAHNNLGMVLAGTPGRQAAAASEFRAAVAANPGFAGAHYNLGNALVAQGSPPDLAVKEFEAALRIEPADVPARRALAQALGRWPGHEQEALPQFEEIVRLEPRSARARLDLGGALLQVRRDLGAAAAEFARATELDPASAEAHYDLGFALQNTPGRLADAAAEFERALQLRPAYPEAHYNLGCVLQALPGRTAEAVAQFRETLRLDPANARAHSNLANAENALGHLPEAIREYEQGLALEPDNPVIHFNLAVVLLKLPARTDDAIAHLRRVLQLRPGDEAATRILRRLGAD